MKDKIDKKIKGQVKITLINDKSEKIIVKKGNLVFDRIYNVMLNNLKPWTNAGDIGRRDESFGQSVSHIGVGTGHHVEDDSNSPLPPKPEWADPDGDWNDLEFELARTPANVYEDASGHSITFTGTFLQNEANGYDLTESGLYLSNGELIAINTFRGFRKTRDYNMRIDWTIKFV